MATPAVFATRRREFSNRFDLRLIEFFSFTSIYRCVHVNQRLRESRVFARTRRRMKICLWTTRPNSSGVRRQLNLPDCRRTLESVSGSVLGSPTLGFADSYARVAVVVFSLYTRYTVRLFACSSPTSLFTFLPYPFPPPRNLSLALAVSSVSLAVPPGRSPVRHACTCVLNFAQTHETNSRRLKSDIIDVFSHRFLSLIRLQLCPSSSTYVSRDFVILIHNFSSFR